MSCAPIPTATLYATVSTFTPSTSYSQSAADTQAQVTTVVQQSCVASGTISGSLIGCISSAQVTQVNTVGGESHFLRLCACRGLETTTRFGRTGGGQAAQVPIVVSVPVAGTQPTQTLFAPCSSGGGSSPAAAPQTTVQSAIRYPIDNTVVTVVTTSPPTAVYVPTSLANPGLQSDAPQGTGTNVAPIVGVGGVGLGMTSLRRKNSRMTTPWRRSVPVRRERDSRRVNSSAEPKPYQYGLVGHVIPPGAAGEPLRTSHYGSVSEHSGVHSRHTSLSATPLLQGTHTGSSRPSTAGSILTVQTQLGPRVLSPVGSTETEPRPLSMVSHSNSTRPLPDGQLTPALLSTWTPNTDDLAVLETPNRSGSPITPAERRVLQIVNDGPPSPTNTVVPGARRTSRLSSGVIVHRDGGRVPASSLAELDVEPPAYSR
ncbi:hypothetical protein J3R82DRAFT_5948 [Butyriboletus roseoflavus]|nr:hypothetical protein J3R82DRAFT_5948 [Butyriboletus roseoflavus]